MSERRHIKLVVVGDGFVQCPFIVVLDDKPYPERYNPEKIVNYTKEILINNVLYAVHIWNTLGKDEFDRLRPLSYCGANVILLLFSLSSKSSFSNLDDYWIREAKFYCRDAKLLLIGTNLDLRETGNPNHVTDQEAEQFVKEHECAAYIPCSPKTGEGIDKILPAAVQAFETPPKKEWCLIC